jgi:type I restriction enzyme R subunit
LSDELARLRKEALTGRQAVVQGLDREETTFYEHVASLAFGDTGVPAEKQAAMKTLMRYIVEILQETIGLIDFWSNPAEQRKLRGTLTDALLMADIAEITENFERLAVEIIKLAKHRHGQLVGDDRR